MKKLLLSTDVGTTTTKVRVIVTREGEDGDCSTIIGRAEVQLASEAGCTTTLLSTSLIRLCESVTALRCRHKPVL